MKLSDECKRLKSTPRVPFYTRRIDISLWIWKSFKVKYTQSINCAISCVTFISSKTKGKFPQFFKLWISWSLTLLKKFYILQSAAAAAAKSFQLCPPLCDPIDSSPPGSPVPRILQARTLEWVTSSFSNSQKWKVKVKSFSHVWLLATPWTAAYQAPPSVGFSRQEHWSGCHCFLRKHYGLLPT